MSIPLPLISWALILLLAPGALAQEPLYRASLPDGILDDQHLDQFASDGLLHLAGKENKVLPGQDLIWLRRVGRPLPEHPAPPFLQLKTGERLALRPDVLPIWKAGRLLVQPRAPVAYTGGDGKGIPVPQAALLCLGHPRTEEELERFWDRLIRAKREGDLVLLKDGDQVEGRIVGFFGKIVHLRAGTRDLNLPLDRVAGVVFGPRFPFTPVDKGPYWRVVLAGGARVDFSVLRLDPKKGAWVGTTRRGTELSFPAASLDALETRRGRSAFLSDRFPLKYETETPFGFSWPLGRDRTFHGRPLRLADGVYDKGLSLPEGGRVDYPLENGWRWFESRVGIDPVDGRPGQVNVEVFLDGKKAGLESDGVLRAGDRPLELRLDLGEARMLSLRVRSGPRLGVGGVVNWTGARVGK